MRLTVTSKVALGLAVIVVIGTLAMLFIYRGLNLVERDVTRLAEVAEPRILAAYEMEINMNGVGLAVLKYLSRRDARYRAWAEKDLADFDGFHSSYSKLINSAQEHALNGDVIQLYAEFKGLGIDLMRRADEQEVVFEMVSERIEQIDDVIDQTLQPALQSVPDLTRDTFGKVIATANMEAEIAELGFWTANYQRVQKPEYKIFIAGKIQHFRDALTDFESYALTSNEKNLVRSILESFDRVTAAIQRVIVLEDAMSSQRDRFIQLRSLMDDLFDDQMQPLALRGLAAPRKTAEAAVDDVLQRTRYLIPLFFVTAISVGWLLIQRITRPLGKLAQGTQAVSGGDLKHRIETHGEDEFSDLGREFNRMIEQLQATTVSRNLLEVSEEKLKFTVDDLRLQIEERERVEAERAKLRVALRRSETMSAIGALVSDIAHEVRNPLFAISATLDAIAARFADRDEYKKYITVLRTEVDRLSKLMADLLEYGKPAEIELRPNAIADVTAKAQQACTPLATQRQIAITQCAKPGLPLTAIDPNRLTQVFQNLIQNAIQHSPPGGMVEVEVGGDSAEIRCSIRDSGPGIEAENLERIFDPFFTRRPGGTGLGLSIVQRIVEDHGGSVTVVNHPEGGTVATVYLPVIAESADLTGRGNADGQA